MTPREHTIRTNPCSGHCAPLHLRVGRVIGSKRMMGSRMHRRRNGPCPRKLSPLPKELLAKPRWPICGKWEALGKIECFGRTALLHPRCSPNHPTEHTAVPTLAAASRHGLVSYRATESNGQGWNVECASSDYWGTPGLQYPRSSEAFDFAVSFPQIGDRGLSQGPKLRGQGPFPP